MLIVYINFLFIPLFQTNNIIFLLKIMFPNVNSKDEPKDKIKEKEWDERLFKTNVPQYSPLKDKHAGTYRKMLMANASTAVKNNEL